MRGSLTVGDVEVSVACEGFSAFELGEEMPGASVDWAAERRRHPWAFHDEASWAWHVHAFILRTPSGVVLVDTGLGPYPPYRPWTHREDDGAIEAIVDPREIRAVVHTHLHADHAGGAVLDDAPRFPNAVHHVHPADWEFFGRPDRIEGYTARRPMEELERLGMLDLREDDHEVVPGVRVVHAPGHSPGHRVAVLESREDALLLAGDLLHVTAQVARPEHGSGHDQDPETGARSRARLLGQARAGAWVVAVSHFARPFGRVEREGWASEPMREGSVPPTVDPG